MSLSAGVAEAMLRDSWWMWEGWKRICLVLDGGGRGCVEGFGVVYEKCGRHRRVSHGFRNPNRRVGFKSIVYIRFLRCSRK